MRVSILAYPDCLGMEVFGIADVLRIANHLAKIHLPNTPRPFDIAIVAARRGRIRMAGGFTLSDLEPHGACDLLVVPAFEATLPADLDRMMERSATEIGLIEELGVSGPVASICGGAFLLAEAGLLDGRRATTAWPFAAELARRYPLATIERDSLIVRDGPVTTVGAFSAVLDLALALISEHVGSSLARIVAKTALLDGARASQARYVDSRLIAGVRASFSDAVMRELAKSLTEPYNLGRLSDKFHVSARTLLRRFKAETGGSPLTYLQGLRVDRAMQILEETDLPLSAVVEQVGYGDVATFSRLFKRRVGQTPAAYRQRFR